MNRDRCWCCLPLWIGAGLIAILVIYGIHDSAPHVIETLRGWQTLIGAFIALAAALLIDHRDGARVQPCLVRYYAAKRCSLTLSRIRWNSVDGAMHMVRYVSTKGSQILQGVAGTSATPCLFLIR